MLADEKRERPLNQAADCYDVKSSEVTAWVTVDTGGPYLFMSDALICTHSSADYRTEETGEGYDTLG